MNKKIIIFGAIFISLVFQSGTVEAVTGRSNCIVPNELTSKAMGPLIKKPEQFLRSSLKDSYTIKNFKAVKSDDFSDAYFLAGEIIEKKTNRSQGVAVWFTPELYAMKGPATKYSTFLSVVIGRTTWDDSGNGYKIKKNVTKKSHGFREVLACY